MHNFILLSLTVLLFLFLLLVIKLHFNFSFTTLISLTTAIFLIYLFIMGRLLGDLILFQNQAFSISNGVNIAVLLIIIFIKKKNRLQLKDYFRNFLFSIKDSISKSIKNYYQEQFLRFIQKNGLLFCIITTFFIITAFSPITSPNMLLQELVAMKWITEEGSLPPINIPNDIKYNNSYLEFFTGGIYQILLAYTYLFGSDFLLRLLTPTIALLIIIATYQLLKNYNLKIKSFYLVFGMILSPILLHFCVVMNSDILVTLFISYCFLFLSEINKKNSSFKNHFLECMSYSIAIMAFAIKFYGFILIYLALFFSLKVKNSNTQNQLKNSNQPFSKKILLVTILPIFLLFMILERNIRIYANLLPPYPIFDVPKILVNVPSIIIAIFLSIEIIYFIVLISFYENKFLKRNILWWLVFLICYVIGLTLIDPTIFLSYFKMAFFSFTTGDITTTFGFIGAFVVFYFLFQKHKIFKKFTQQINNFYQSLIRGYALIVLSQVILLQHFSEGPIRYSFSFLFCFFPIVGYIFQYYLEKYFPLIIQNAKKKLAIHKIHFRRSCKIILQITFSLSILYLFLGGPTGYLNPPGYLVVSPIYSDDVDLLHWRPYAINAINYVNERTNSTERILFTDAYVYFFDNPFNVITFSPNDEHRNRAVYTQFNNLHINCSNEEIISILQKNKITYLVTALGYSLELVIEQLPIIDRLLNMTITQLVFYEKAYQLPFSSEKYAAVWHFVY